MRWQVERTVRVRRLIALREHPAGRWQIDVASSRQHVKTPIADRDWTDLVAQEDVDDRRHLIASAATAATSTTMRRLR